MNFHTAAFSLPPVILRYRSEIHVQMCDKGNKQVWQGVALKEKGRSDKWWRNKKKEKGSEEIGNAEERGQEQRFFAKEWSGDAERSV